MRGGATNRGYWLPSAAQGTGLEWGSSRDREQNAVVREWLIRGALIVALLVAAASLYLAFATGREEEPVVRRGAITRVFPKPGAVVLRQEPIGVELAFGYRASILVDGRPIPDDQLDVVQGINRVSFTPGDGKEIEQLDEGRHCASVEFGLSTTTTAENTTVTAMPETYSWCFSAA